MTTWPSPEATPRGRHPRGYGEAAHDCPWTAIGDGQAGSRNVIRRLPCAFLPVQVPPQVSRRVVNFDFFGQGRSGAVYVRGGAGQIPMPLGNRRQTVYGGVTMDGQTCCMAAAKANDRSFIRYLNRLKKQFGKAAMMADNAAYQNPGRVRRCLEGSDDFVKLIFLPPYSPFLNPGKCFAF